MFVEAEMTCLAETLRKIDRIVARMIQGICLMCDPDFPGLFKKE
jgi:hypothetical protein